MNASENVSEGEKKIPTKEELKNQFSNLIKNIQKISREKLCVLKGESLLNGLDYKLVKEIEEVKKSNNEKTDKILKISELINNISNKVEEIIMFFGQLNTKDDLDRELKEPKKELEKLLRNKKIALITTKIEKDTLEEKVFYLSNHFEEIIGIQKDQINEKNFSDIFKNPSIYGQTILDKKKYEEIKKLKSIVDIRMLEKYNHLCYDINKNLKDNLSKRSFVFHVVLFDLFQKGNFTYASSLITSDPSSIIHIKNFREKYFEKNKNKNIKNDFISRIEEKYDIEEMKEFFAKFHAYKDKKKISEDLNRSKLPELIDEVIYEAIRLEANDLIIKFNKFVYRLNGLNHPIGGKDKAYVINKFLDEPKIRQGVNIVINNKSNSDFTKRIHKGGNIEIYIDGNPINLRVESSPDEHFSRQSEVFAIRLPNKNKIDFKELGHSDHVEKPLIESIEKKGGKIYWIIGKTGSGKSTTILSIFKIMVEKGKNIFSIVDTIEFDDPDIPQTKIDPITGVTWLNSIESALRKNPDALWIGETRTPETAEAVILAAQSGVKVYSTLHAENAAGGFSKLLALKITPQQIINTKMGMVYQYFFNIPCSHCRIDYSPSKESLEKIEDLYGITLNEDIILYKKSESGCKDCNYVGYAKGRTIISEILEPSLSILDAIERGVNVFEINRLAIKEGMSPIIIDALLKIEKGVGTIDELFEMFEKYDDETKKLIGKIYQRIKNGETMEEIKKSMKEEFGQKEEELNKKTHKDIIKDEEINNVGSSENVQKEHNSSHLEKKPFEIKTFKKLSDVNIEDIEEILKKSGIDTQGITNENLYIEDGKLYVFHCSEDGNFKGYIHIKALNEIREALRKTNTDKQEKNTEPKPEKHEYNEEIIGIPVQVKYNHNTSISRLYSEFIKLEIQLLESFKVQEITLFENFVPYVNDEFGNIYNKLFGEFPIKPLNIKGSNKENMEITFLPCIKNQTVIIDPQLIVFKDFKETTVKEKEPIKTEVKVGVGIANQTQVIIHNIINPGSPQKPFEFQSSSDIYNAGFKPETEIGEIPYYQSLNNSTLNENKTSGFENQRENIFKGIEITHKITTEDSSDVVLDKEKIELFYISFLEIIRHNNNNYPNISFEEVLLEIERIYEYIRKQQKEGTYKKIIFSFYKNPQENEFFGLKAIIELDHKSEIINTPFRFSFKEIEKILGKKTVFRYIQKNPDIFLIENNTQKLPEIIETTHKDSDDIIFNKEESIINVEHEDVEDLKYEEIPDKNVEDVENIGHEDYIYEETTDESAHEKWLPVPTLDLPSLITKKVRKKFITNIGKNLYKKIYSNDLQVSENQFTENIKEIIYDIFKEYDIKDLKNIKFAVDKNKNGSITIKCFYNIVQKNGREEKGYKEITISEEEIMRKNNENDKKAKDIDNCLETDPTTKKIKEMIVLLYSQKPKRLQKFLKIFTKTNELGYDETNLKILYNNYKKIMKTLRKLDPDIEKNNNPKKLEFLQEKICNNEEENFIGVSILSIPNKKKGIRLLVETLEVDVIKQIFCERAQQLNQPYSVSIETKDVEIAIQELANIIIKTGVENYNILFSREYIYRELEKISENLFDKCIGELNFDICFKTPFEVEISKKQVKGTSIYKIQVIPNFPLKLEYHL